MLGMTIQAGQQSAASPVASQQMRAALAALRDQPIPATSKGFGRLAGGYSAASQVAGGHRVTSYAADASRPGAGSPGVGILTSASLAGRRPYLLGPDFVLPVLVLREAALGQNIAAMARY